MLLKLVETPVEIKNWIQKIKNTFKHITFAYNVASEETYKTVKIIIESKKSLKDITASSFKFVINYQNEYKKPEPISQLPQNGTGSFITFLSIFC